MVHLLSFDNHLKCSLVPSNTRQNDENQQASLKDPLHVLVGPITRARSKMIKEALSGKFKRLGLVLKWAIQTWAQRKMKE